MEKKVAWVHDWLVSVAGGERVLQAAHELYPGPIHTLVVDQKKLKGSYFEGVEIVPSFIQNLPFARKKYRSYLPLFPLAIEQFDLAEYDVIFSSSHCVAKGVIPRRAGQLHICYCHTPVRYAWDLYHLYLKEEGLDRGIKGMLAKFFLHYLRNWDYLSSSRVNVFIANSRFTQERIQRTYGRESRVIYPPVAVDFYEMEEKKEEYYLTASRLVSYKKVDLIVEAFSSLPEKRLVVVGRGPEEEKIRKRAGKNIEFVGYPSDEELKRWLQKARGFIFAAEEDFGIIPVEAMACGTPVLAYGGGGALETIQEGRTGLFFKEQTVESLLEGLGRFERGVFDPKVVRQRAEEFSKERFQRELAEEVGKWLK